MDSRLVIENFRWNFLPTNGSSKPATFLSGLDSDRIGRGYRAEANYAGVDRAEGTQRDIKPSTYANSLRRQARPRGKQWLVSSLAWCMLLLVLVSTGSACIIPPDLEIRVDRQDSSPPIVVAVAPPEFASPGPPLLLEINDERLMSLTVEDNDFADSVYIRFFVDYNRPDRLGPRADCSAPSSGELETIVTCSMATICNAVTFGEDHFLEAVIADMPFLETSDPNAAGGLPFRALPEEASSSITSWSLRCLEADG